MTGDVEPDRGLSGGVRALLTVFAVLTLLATHQLFVRAEHTAQGFAWTIQPPLTAAFFGAGYAAGCVLVLLALQRGTWASARVGYLTVLLFVVLASAATLLHLDRFHFDAADALPRAAAWIWLAVYLVVQAAVLLVAGVALFLVDSSRGLWPWELTELTARAMASWLVALGVGAVLAVAQDDLVRLRPAAITSVVLAVLQLAALVRFGGDVAWDRPSSAVYVLALLGMLTVGVAGVVRARGHVDRVRAAAGQLR